MSTKTFLVLLTFGLFILSTPQAFAYEKTDLNGLIAQSQQQQANSIATDQYIQSVITSNQAVQREVSMPEVKSVEPFNIYLPHAQ